MRALQALKLIVLGISLSSATAYATSAGNQTLECPQGYYVNRVHAQGMKGMSVSAGGYNNGFLTEEISRKSGVCQGTHGWAQVLKEVSLECYNPVTKDTTHMGRVNGEDGRDLSMDERLFEDKWLSPTYEKAKMDMGAQCAPNEMVVFNPNAPETDAFCEDYQASVKPFLCVPYDPFMPSNGFNFWKARDTQIYVFKLGSSLQNTLAQRMFNYTYIAFATPFGDLATQVNAQLLKAPEVMAARLEVPAEQLRSATVAQILNLYAEACSANMNAHLDLVRAAEGSDLRKIEGRSCWFTEDELKNSPLNRIVVELEAALKTLNQNKTQLNAIEADLEKPSFNVINTIRLIKLRYGNKARSLKELNRFFEGLPSVKELAAQANRIQKDRIQSYLKWYLLIKVYLLMSESNSTQAFLREQIQSILHSPPPRPTTFPLKS